MNENCATLLVEQNHHTVTFFGDPLLFLKYTKMPYWYYEKEELRNTLSIQDGLDYQTECRYRREGAELISDMGIQMELGYNTIATAVVFFHRFYMFQSFQNFPHYVTACCCLFLAGKVEETPKKSRDVLLMASTMLSDRELRKFGYDPMNELFVLERILLQTIKFDFVIEHPYGYLLKYAKVLRGNKNRIREMLQMAWTFVNDSLRTTLSLQWEAEIIAVAVMYLAGKLCKIDASDWKCSSPKHRQWWESFVEDVTKDLMEDICHQVMEPYSSIPESSSTTTDSSE